MGSAPEVRLVAVNVGVDDEAALQRLVAFYGALGIPLDDWGHGPHDAVGPRPAHACVADPDGNRIVLWETARRSA